MRFCKAAALVATIWVGMGSRAMRVKRQEVRPSTEQMERQGVTPPIDTVFADALQAFIEDPPSLQDNQRRHGPHRELRQDTPMAKRSKLRAEEAEHLAYGKQQSALNLFADEVLCDEAPGEALLAPRDSRRWHGPPEDLPQDSLTSEHNEWRTNTGEHLEHRRRSQPTLVSTGDPRNNQHRRGSTPVFWTAEEDERLKKLTEEFADGLYGSWTTIAIRLGNRSRKQCWDRWHKRLRRMNKGPWTPGEEQELLNRVHEVGEKWARIRKLYLPKRSVHEIRNRWLRLQNTLTALRD